MNIPQIDQDLATIKATDVQYRNDYHLSEKDYADFYRAFNNINELAELVKKRQAKDQGHSHDNNHN